jgi:hypothetical protein
MRHIFFVEIVFMHVVRYCTVVSMQQHILHLGLQYAVLGLDYLFS